MKPNELMIGDWVEYGQYITTVRHLSDKIVLSGCVGRLDEVRPVPITTEILEANGFESRELYHFTLYQLGKESFSIAYDLLLKNLCAFTKTVNTGCRMCKTPDKSELSIQIQYVHELQQAMRLIGLRDLADNFVIKKGGSQ